MWLKLDGMSRSIDPRLPPRLDRGQVAGPVRLLGPASTLVMSEPFDILAIERRKLLEVRTLVQVAIEYSHNLGPEADMETLFRKVARKLCDSDGVFLPSSVQVTGRCVMEYVVGDGPGERAFVNLSVGLGARRPEDLRSGYLQELFDVVTDHLADLYQRRRLSIAMQVLEPRAIASFQQDNFDAPAPPLDI